VFFEDLCCGTKAVPKLRRTVELRKYRVREVAKVAKAQRARELRQ
jgi:hypothetical protein